MDVVLEIADTFVGDYIYAQLLPLNPATSSHDILDVGANSTAQALSSWQFKSANPYFQIEPSEYAYMSAWEMQHSMRSCCPSAYCQLQCASEKE